MTDIGDKCEGIWWGYDYVKTGKPRSFMVPGLDQTLLYLVEWPSGDLEDLCVMIDYAPRVTFNGTRIWI